MELELETRKRIFETIRSSPGIHLRELERSLGIAVGSLQYHLHYMQKKNIISAQKDEQFLRYFVRDKELSENDRLVMSFLRKKACRHILITLMENPDLNNKDISSAIGLSPSTVSWHLNKLVASGVVNKIINGRESNFEVINPEEITELIITYKSSFFDRMLDNFIEMWELDTVNHK
ncbi:winged helix-turn-helix transcriptional regulator [Methanolobus sediminis]|uniref:Winged helix-turn-helix transcriptional regulator n=1 Tax=Methanolobus sediminis TaxID=3072978 RepID=A0AA51UMC1_9EURY|nr:winged helix-turn-helix transcriptional regulator [Methanolobus sediminis]WMW26272.1 winged helix-turn-helix transcriptional regulator [Methanolobus sediminis]